MLLNYFYFTVKFFLIFIIFSIPRYHCQTLYELDSLNREYWNKGQVEEAANFNIQALCKYEKQGNNDGIIATYINTANAFSYLDKQKEGVDYLDKAKKRIKKTDNPFLSAKLYNQYGKSYSLLGLYHLSNKNLNKAIFYLKHIPNQKQQKRSLLFANVWKWYNFNKLGFTDSANIIQFRNLKLFPDNPSVYEKIASVYIWKNIHLDSAEYYLQKALPLSNKTTLYNKGTILNSFGDLYMAEGEYKKALQYFLQSLTLYQKMKNKINEKEIYLRISKAYKALSDNENSSEYLRKYSLLNDDIINKEKKDLSNVLEKFIKEKEDEEKREKKQLYLMIFTITIIFSTLIYINRNNYQKKQKKKDKLIEEKTIEANKLKKQINNAFEEVIQLAKTNDPFFLIRFKEVYSEFYENLIFQYSCLTEHDVKFCAYMRLNLSNKEIIQYENISLRTVESKKYRLKKKLGLAAEINLNKWIMEL